MIFLNKVLRKQTLKKLCPMMIIAGILALAFLAVSCQGMLSLISGPQPLSPGNVEEEGSYVSFDASQVIVAFASLSVSSDSGSQVLETYYLLPAGDGTYLAVMDPKETNDNVLNRAMEQSHEYYLGDLENLTRLGDLSGTLVPLEDDMESYMVDCITNYSLPGYDADSVLSLIRPVQVNLNKVGFLSVTQAVVLFGIGLGFLAVLLLILIPALAGAYQKKATAVVLGECTVQEAEDAFKQAKNIERVYVDKFIWFPKGAATRVLKTSDLVWGYPMPEPLVVSKYRWPVALYDQEQNCTQICFMDSKNRQVFLDAIKAQGHPFVDTYTSALSQKFKNDPEGFVKDAARKTEE